MLKLTRRQNLILNFIKKNQAANSSSIKNYLESESGEKISRITVIRDINELLKNNLIQKQGAGRNICYTELTSNELLKYVDAGSYFLQEIEQRKIFYPKFNFDIFSHLKDGLFSSQENEELDGVNRIYQNRVKSLSPAVAKKELERLTIELSWKSSQIEGNTYSLIDTEVLIKENKEAAGHQKEEAAMILNHKQALDHIIQNRTKFKKLDLRKIEDVHRLIVQRLNINYGFRKSPVGITGTKYQPLDNQHQIKEAMERLTAAVNKIHSPFAKALSLILMLSYIQPFEDGNKRTSRLMGNAVLLAHDCCPLSYRSINESDYKKALILFYEQNSALFFKELFIEQFKFAVGNYFN